MRPTFQVRLRFSLQAAACLALAAVTIPACAARKPRPPEPLPAVTIDMEALGFRRISDRILQSGRSVLSVNFVTSDRLLVTYLSRGLIRRDPEATEADNDHQIEALVLDLPGGTLVARTTWRVHDQDQYLWPLPNGHFLFRDRNRLRMIDARRPGEEALASHPVFDAGNGRLIVNVTVTRDGSLVEVQTQRGKLIGDDLGLEGDPDKDRSKSFDVRFLTPSENADSLVLRAHATTAELFLPPFNKDGFLSSEQEDATHFGFNLHHFIGGKVTELAGIETTCEPGATFVSATEFLVSACRGGADPNMTGVLDTKGNVLWLETESVNSWVAVDSAPNAKRFAIRRTVTTVFQAANSTALVPETVLRPRTQAVTVRTTTNGDDLLTVSNLPVVRALQNFALSSDGLRLAVWRDDGIAVYEVPK